MIRVHDDQEANAPTARWYTLDNVEQFATELFVMVEQLREKE
jgi:hypothetical protein